MPSFSTIAWVLLGGGIGSVARFMIQRWAASQGSSFFPYGTIMVNVAGCLLIGFFFQWGARTQLLSEQTKLFLMTGVCGGFTTFSAVTLESLLLLQQQKWATALLYISLTMMLGMCATLLGYWLAKTIIPN